MEGIKKSDYFVGGAGFCAIAIIVAPFVVIVVAPLFAALPLHNYVRHEFLYQKTLTNLTKELFGRIAGQDYTPPDSKPPKVGRIESARDFESGGLYMRCDGRAIDKSNMTSPALKAEKAHGLIGQYLYGGNGWTKPIKTL